MNHQTHALTALYVCMRTPPDLLRQFPYVYMCMHARIYIYIYIHIYMYIYEPPNTCLDSFVCVHAYTPRSSSSISKQCKLWSTCQHPECMYVCVYIYIYACVHPQIFFVNFQAVQTMEHMPALGVFAIMQVWAVRQTLQTFVVNWRPPGAPPNWECNEEGVRVKQKLVVMWDRFQVYMLRSCFDLIACTRSTFGNGCILSRFFSFILTSNKFLSSFRCLLFKP